MKFSKSDEREIAALLDQDHDSVEELARAVLARAFFLYEQRGDHALLFQEAGVPIVVRGFSTEAGAVRWAVKQGLTEEEAVLAVVKTEGQI